jgi:peroxiredoxin
MRRTEGSQVPDFEIETLDGVRLSRANLHGQRWLLSFYRYAACPLCNLRLHQVAERAPRWLSQGVRVIAVSQSPATRGRKLWSRHQLPIDLIADPDRRLYDLFGVEQSLMQVATAGADARIYVAMAKGFLPGVPDGPMGTLPADFLVERDGTVRTAFYARGIGDHLPLGDIDAFANG